MEDELLVANDNGEPETIKYISRLYRNGAHICNGCLISPRHIVTSAACIKKLTRNLKRISKKLFAVMMQQEHKIINTVYHPNYKPGEFWYHRFYNFGVALVRLLISCIY